MQDNGCRFLTAAPKGYKALFEFHISGAARDYYDFDQELFSFSGNVILANFHSTRLFAKQMNDKRDVVNHPEKAVLPGQINAMALIDEILHYVSSIYRQEHGVNILADALGFLEAKVGKKALDRVLLHFATEFPNVEVHQRKISPEDFLAGQSEELSHREVILEEILLLWLANVNPAFGPYQELFDDKGINAVTEYSQVIQGLGEFFGQAQPFGPDNQNLVDMLRSPAIAVPDSLYGQLQYIKEKWGSILGKYLLRLLSSLDFMKEEERLFWKGGFHAEGYANSLEFGGMDNEPERFSPDKEWMPRVIVLAKSTLVWLDQLSRKYQREIRRLDQIPDEELDNLAHRGFNALWLIGLWERSKASKTIKQMCGNPEAEASAYSLHDYDIAWELGGWDAMGNLRDRCWQRGIRVASDMVPNHTGIDSRWISEHPDWYLQLDYSPFPNYSFGGRDLSQDPNVGVFLEDHYFDRSDAAVCFKHVDYRTGRERYIYHGNDGTSMPWNDTAQLNYLNPDTREAVIQTILHVARNFSIIRFDAAMTLAKRHIQRLWFPQPGSGGDIASRSDHALTKEDFDRAMPEEFWREVVDRVAKEVPETLLLAEAFWMMEGYFVRSLGMHRVYNSAFMHMFKKEENKKYRYTIKNTLEFDPQILKRFVNFMNNPDEETAAVQFGTGDKYFGVATMMITMPGTPMFGHGQVEGFREKYGMEYRKAYWDEQEDYGLIQRHEHEIFPLMHKRYIFAEVHNFFLYDLWSPDGHVNENVFAFSNKAGHEQALVFYNNSYERAAGWIKTSAGFSVKNGSGSKEIQQLDLHNILGLTQEHNRYVLLREHNQGLWFIRKSEDIIQSGLYVELGGYQKQVFLDIHEVQDNEMGHFGRLHHELDGRGVPDIDEALKDIFLGPLYEAFHSIVNKETFLEMKEFTNHVTPPSEEFWTDMANRLSYFFEKAKEYSQGQGNVQDSVQCTLGSLKAAISLGQAPQFFEKDKKVKPVLDILKARLEEPSDLPYAFFIKGLFSCLGSVVSQKDHLFLSRSLIDDWLLDRKTTRVLIEVGLGWDEAHHLMNMAKFMIANQQWFDKSLGKEKALPGILLTNLLTDREFQTMIGENRFEGTLYFNKEGFEYVKWWLSASAFMGLLKQDAKAEALAADVKLLHSVISAWDKAVELSEYKVEGLMDQLVVKTKASAKKAGTPKKAPAKKPSGKKKKP
jgi:glycosidase